MRKIVEEQTALEKTLFFALYNNKKIDLKNDFYVKKSFYPNYILRKKLQQQRDTSDPQKKIKANLKIICQ